MAELPEHGLTRDEIRDALRLACATVHGQGAGMSLLQLSSLILEHGLPPRAERERLLAAKLAEDPEADDTTAFSSPELLDRRDAPDATAGG